MLLILAENGRSPQLIATGLHTRWLKDVLNVPDKSSEVCVSQAFPVTTHSCPF